MNFLESFNPTLSEFDLYKSTLNLGLEKILEATKDKQVVLVGESSHGTSEFSQSKHLIFQNLVLQYNFNTFFLEARPDLCLQINDYIQHKHDDFINAFLRLPLVWQTREMAEVIQWMRNISLKEGISLNFFGIDITKEEVHRWIDNPLSVNRDERMGQNIVQFLEQNPDAKGMVSAHNVHIKYKTSFIQDSAYWFPHHEGKTACEPMGKTLKTLLGN